MFCSVFFCILLTTVHLLYFVATFVNTGQRDEIRVAIQGWLWERIELMAW